MPYIQQNRRHELQYGPPLNAGDLNYEISFIVDRYLRHRSLCYAAINEAIGALECAKLELYRRVAAPYEDKKKEENGDVYSVVQE